MKEALMIDYVNEETGKFERKTVDNMEFCVREGIAYFDSCGKTYSIPLENISQMFISGK